MNDTAIRQPTKPMFKLVRDLLTELAEVNATAAENWRTELNLIRERGQFDFTACSEAIEDIKRAKRDERRKVNATTGANRLPNVPEGRYAIEIDGVMKFYVIEVSDKGFVTGFAQASDEHHELAFPALRKVLATIELDGPKNCSIRYGKELGVCGRCGATLTSKWRLAGIGPKCSQMF